MTAGAERARWAITAVFGCSGISIASMAVRTPSLKLDVGLSDGALGLMTALFGVAAVVCMQALGGFAARVGSAPLVRVAALAVPASLLAVGVAPDIWWLAAAQVLFGAAHGTIDVTMNAHAVAVERALGRPVLNGCHAAWTIGAVLGSLLGSGAVQLGLTRPVHYAVLAAVLVPLALLCGRALLPAGCDRKVADPDGRPGWRAGWTRPVLVLGAMGAAVLTCDAAVAVWSGVYLHEKLASTLGVASLGYVALTGCETAGRLVGDRLLTRTPAVRLLRVGTATAIAGLLLVVLSPWAAGAIVGFAVMGIGLATPLPVLFGVVGHLGAQGAGAATMVARFSTITYSGILLAPAIIGWVAQAVGLTWTLAGLIPLLAAVGYGARVAERPAARAVAYAGSAP